MQERAQREAESLSGAAADPSPVGSGGDGAGPSGEAGGSSSTADGPAGGSGGSSEAAGSGSSAATEAGVGSSA